MGKWAQCFIPSLGVLTPLPPNVSSRTQLLFVFVFFNQFVYFISYLFLTLLFQGLANKSSTARPLLYLTYARPFFRDEANFSAKRYRDLPPLVPYRKRKSKDEAEAT